jgi:tetratricopeptide (TPR) repeat protein
MAVFSYTDLERLIENEQYSEAEAICQEAIASSVDKLFWRTQLGYVYFLNFPDEDYPENSIAIFEALVKDYPNDPNAHFWFGYLNWIFYSEIDFAITELLKVLELEPNHPYARLVLAGHNADHISSLVPLMQQIQIQPNNYRALMQSGDFYRDKKNLETAREFYLKIIQNPPYIETGYGIMNTYINDVFTFATRAEDVKNETKEILKNL